MRWRARRKSTNGEGRRGMRTSGSRGLDGSTLQRQSKGYVRPDASTHGSSEERVRWFKTGLESGEMGSCDTFGRP